MTRRPPNIAHTEPMPDYALPLCANYDWWQEALNVVYPDALWDRMAKAKADAVELDERRATPITFMLGGELFQLQAHGSRGREFLLVNDDMRLEFGPRKMEWSVTWRATAAALWEHGVDAIRERMYTLLEAENINPRNAGERCQSLTRVDFAFDFWSPAFSKEMRPEIANAIVCPAEVKEKASFYIKGKQTGTYEGQLQTLTIGSHGGCQVQMYEKTAEITEASGKTWMYDIWGELGGYWPTGKPGDVWRLEVRLAGEWLKNRTGKDIDRFLEHREQIIADALYNRRLTVPSETDSNHRRWPLHPLYTLAMRILKNPDEFVPVGHKTTQRAEALKKTLLLNAAGNIRSLHVLKSKGIDDEKRRSEEFEDEALDDLMKTVRTAIVQDQAHGKKIHRAENRYEFVEEAR